MDAIPLTAYACQLMRFVGPNARSVRTTERALNDQGSLAGLPFPVTPLLYHAERLQAIALRKHDTILPTVRNVLVDVLHFLRNKRAQKPSVGPVIAF